MSERSLELLTSLTRSDPLLGGEVHAFDLKAVGVTELLNRHLRTWSAEHRGGPGPRIHIYPSGTTNQGLAPGHVIDKRHRRVVLSWPEGPAPTWFSPW